MQAFLSPHSTPSIAFIHFLSTGFILLWRIFLGVGAYCHQIGSFLKGLSSIAHGILLGTKHVPLQLCWVGKKNVLLKNWFLGETSQTWWDFHGNSVLECGDWHNNSNNNNCWGLLKHLFHQNLCLMFSTNSLIFLVDKFFVTFISIF